MAERDVLIVDDDAQVGDLLCQIFGAAGYPCRRVGDGGEALEVFKVWRPPLVVTDVLHPGITGIELLRQVRAVDGDVAVIVLTGAGDVMNAIESVKLGAHAFLMKPINVDELLITAARALERRQLLIERRQHQEPYGQFQEPDRTALGRAALAQRDVLILVVEEDRQIRKLLQQIFDSAGYRCLLAGDGEEGLKVFRQSRPSLVIADLGMPMVRGGKSVRDAGIRLLLEIRQEDPNAAVIVASGNPDVKIAIESLKLGAYAFLMKPVNAYELLITAERALERRQLLIERRHRQQAYGQPQADPAQRTVLIVAVEEDRPAVRDVVRAIFDSAGYKCLLTGYWGRGLKAFRESRPPLVFIDLRTMVMGHAGIKLLREIREEDPDAAVIVTSASVDPKIGIESLKLGAYAFLVKPINMDELLITAERALEHRQLLIEHRQHQADT